MQNDCTSGFDESKEICSITNHATTVTHLDHFDLSSKGTLNIPLRRFLESKSQTVAHMFNVGARVQWIHTFTQHSFCDDENKTAKTLDEFLLRYKLPSFTKAAQLSQSVYRFS